MPAARDNAKSHPFFIHKVKLHSFHAQQVFDRSFEVCASAIFTLTIVLRIVGTDEQAREVEAIVDERLRKMFEDMRAETVRLDKVAEGDGTEFSGIDYSRPKEIDARINSPRAVRFVGLIREFDGLVSKFDTLWLSGVIPDSDYSRNLYDWKRRLIRLARGIRSISGRAMSAARRKESLAGAPLLDLEEPKGKTNGNASSAPDEMPPPASAITEQGANAHSLDPSALGTD